MEDIEIALALLEIIAILLPLSLVAFGMVFRVLQSGDIRSVIGVDKLSKVGYIFGLLLAYLSLAGALIIVYISIFIDSILVILAIIFLIMSIGVLLTLGAIFASIFSQIYQHS